MVYENIKTVCNIVVLFHVKLFLYRLDKALIRPGRVDVKELIDYASEYQLHEMFRRFYPDEPESSAHEFAAKVLALQKPVSAAQVQGYFMLHKNEPQAVIENVIEIADL